MKVLIAWLFLSKALHDGMQSATFKIYVFVISAYASVQIIFSLLMSVPCCHGLTDACYRWSVVRLAKWMHQVLSFLAHSDFLKAMWCNIFCEVYLTFGFCWRSTTMLEETCMKGLSTISSNPIEHRSIVLWFSSRVGSTPFLTFFIVQMRSFLACNSCRKIFIHQFSPGKF